MGQRGASLSAPTLTGDTTTANTLKMPLPSVLVCIVSYTYMCSIVHNIRNMCIIRLFSVTTFKWDFIRES